MPNDSERGHSRSDEVEPAAHDSAVPPAYAPNAILRWLYRRFFDAIAVDPAWVASVREASRRGTVVYALRNLSFLDFLALDHLTKRFGLPQVRFANDLGLWILEPAGPSESGGVAPGGSPAIQKSRVREGENLPKRMVRPITP
ncbi:MAG: hypothetical protein ACHREM_31150 [Polyangiales bacterium]